MSELAKGRVCGECTACCKTHGVTETDSGNGTWCRECRIGVGCRIYDSRPEPCRLYQCLWLMGLYEDRDRPDILKIVMDGGFFDIGGRRIGVINMWEVERKARSSQRAQSIRDLLLSEGYVVRDRVYLGPNRLRDHYHADPTLIDDAVLDELVNRLRELERSPLPPQDP